MDIDALAARLSAEAEKLRRSTMGSADLDADAAEEPTVEAPRQPTSDLGPFGYEVRTSGLLHGHVPA